jgi:hypothetical protein
VTLILTAAVMSFLLSIALWFTRQPGRGRVRGAVGAVDPRGGRLLDGRSEDAMTALDVLLAVAGLVRWDEGRRRQAPRRNLNVRRRG